MRKVNAILVKLPENHPWSAKRNKYSVFLNARLTVYLSTKKEAVLLESAFNAWVSDIAIKVNDCFAACFADFRALWVFYDNDVQECRRIELQLNSIDKNIENVYRLTSPGSGLMLQTKNLINACEDMITIYEVLSAKQKARNNYQAIVLYKFRIDLLQMLLNQLNNPAELVIRALDAGRFELDY